MRDLLKPRSIAILWLGILCGLYVIEFPARFGSTEASYTAALDIGRRVFERLIVAEHLLWAALAATVFFSRASRWSFIAVAVVAAVISIDRWVLLPELIQRNADILAGATLEASSAHTLYSRLEIVKGLALVFLAVFGAQRQSAAAGRD